MNCPLCRRVSLQEFHLPRSRLAADRCRECGGLWFDGGELESVLDVAHRELRIPDYAKPCPLLCPRCGGELEAFAYPGTDVTVDMCRRCRGLWLDQGELQQIRSGRSSLRKEELHRLEMSVETPGKAFLDLLEEGGEPPRTCLRCGRGALKPLALQYWGIVVDRCDVCGGIWFDGGELEQVLDLCPKKLKVPWLAKKSELRCLHCDRRLHEFRYLTSMTVIDMCKKCRSIWLDHGEFAAIRELLGVLEGPGRQ